MTALDTAPSPSIEDPVIDGTDTRPTLGPHARFGAHRWNDGSPFGYVVQSEDGALHSYSFVKVGREVDRLGITSFKPGPAANPSSLAMVGWDDRTTGRLYFQARDTYRLQEWTFADLKWSDGNLTSLPTTQKDSGLAALAWAGGKQLRLYYCDPETGDLREYVWDKDHWKSGEAFAAHPRAGSAIAAAQWNEGQRICVYFWPDDGDLCQVEWRSDGWSKPRSVILGDGKGADPANFARYGLASVAWPGDAASTVSLYLVDVRHSDRSIVREYLSTDGLNFLEGTLSFVDAFSKTALTAAAWQGGESREVIYINAQDELIAANLEDGQWVETPAKILPNPPVIPVIDT